MGMFDYITCKYPLPLEGANDLTYQTKDTPAQFLDNYEIREDGTLWHEEYDTKIKIDKSKEGVEALLGCMKKVNVKWNPCKFTGGIVFYTTHKDEPITWISFFIEGKIKEIYHMEGKE